MTDSRNRYRVPALGGCLLAAALGALVLGGCGSRKPADLAGESAVSGEGKARIVMETEPEESPVLDGIGPLTMDGPDYEALRICRCRRRSRLRSICSWGWSMKRWRNCRPG